MIHGQALVGLLGGTGAFLPWGRQAQRPLPEDREGTGKCTRHRTHPETHLHQAIQVSITCGES